MQVLLSRCGQPTSGLKDDIAERLIRCLEIGAVAETTPATVQKLWAGPTRPSPLSLVDQFEADVVLARAAHSKKEQ